MVGTLAKYLGYWIAILLTFLLLFLLFLVVNDKLFTLKWSIDLVNRCATQFIFN